MLVKLTQVGLGNWHLSIIQWHTEEIDLQETGQLAEDPNPIHQPLRENSSGDYCASERTDLRHTPQWGNSKESSSSQLSIKELYSHQHKETFFIILPYNRSTKRQTPANESNQINQTKMSPSVVCVVDDIKASRSAYLQFNLHMIISPVSRGMVIWVWTVIMSSVCAKSCHEMHMHISYPGSQLNRIDTFRHLDIDSSRWYKGDSLKTIARWSL